MAIKPATHRLTGRVHRMKRAERPRQNSYQRGYTPQWHAARKRWLRDHPWCAECLRIGRQVKATVVDHVRPHLGDTRLFWDTSNWQSLCKRCHDSKTCAEDGGFGNRRT